MLSRGLHDVAAWNVSETFKADSIHCRQTRFRLFAACNYLSVFMGAPSIVATSPRRNVFATSAVPKNYLPCVKSVSSLRAPGTIRFLWDACRRGVWTLVVCCSGAMGDPEPGVHH